MDQSIPTSPEQTDSFRIAEDSLGKVQVPATALWGAQTQRALANFPISGIRFGRRFIAALAYVKRACALSNMALSTLDVALGGPILQACDEMIVGQLDAHFPIDIFQTGSGTSTNMNANEVLANRANQILDEKRPANQLEVHPNDHVNKSQSSNDVIPTVAHVALTLALREDLIPSLGHLAEVLETKAEAFDSVVKTGRTHLQDATPIRMGQVFGGFAAQARYSVARARRAMTAVCELPLGGTAVGTGLNCPLGFPAMAIEHLNVALSGEFAEAANHVEANAARDGLVEASGLLKTIAVSLHKIANDIRWMASGPRSGFAELHLPAVQPGSSIMPGKVNPVIAEALIMVCAQVVGMDVANTLGGLGGAFELNLMMPLLAHNTLSATALLASAARNFADRCIAGLEVDAERCRSFVSRNLTLATALAPVIGYDRAAKIAKEAQRTGKTVREVALAQQVLPTEQLDALLDPARMTEPGMI